MKTKYKKIIFFTILLSISMQNVFAQIIPYDLKLEYRSNPEGVDVKQPRFFWKLKSEESGQFQKAYQIIVATSKEKIEKNLGDVFHSKKVKSSQSTQIEYQGIPLKSASQYYWKVRVWDKNNDVSEWSKLATFSTGLLEKEDWKGAQWIAWKNQDEWANEWWRKKEVESKAIEFQLPSYFGAHLNMFERFHFFDDKKHDAAPLLRKGFNVKKKVKSAKAYISGIGYYELYINGKKIGNSVLDPGWTDYRKTILYATHDITKELKDGENMAGVMLGRGFYGMMAYDHWGFYKKSGWIGQAKINMSY